MHSCLRKKSIDLSKKKQKEKTQKTTKKQPKKTQLRNTWIFICASLLAERSHLFLFNM